MTMMDDDAAFEVTPEPDRIAFQGGRIQFDPDGELDELVLNGVAHLERMDTNEWWIGVGLTEDGPNLHISIAHGPDGTIDDVLTEWDTDQLRSETTRWTRGAVDREDDQ